VPDIPWLGDPDRRYGDDVEFCDEGEPEEDAASGTDWVTGADPSWFPRVLQVLQRDFPNISDRVWSVAIREADSKKRENAH
jgi:hypothetical protein